MTTQTEEEGSEMVKISVYLPKRLRDQLKRLLKSRRIDSMSKGVAFLIEDEIARSKDATPTVPSS